MESPKTKYSNDFSFFLKEQIGIVLKNKGKCVCFFSRLNGIAFKTIDHNQSIPDDEIIEICKSIHLNLPKYNNG